MSYKMHQYKIIARILLILPVINFVFALPIAVQETRQVCGDAVPDVAITMSAKRGDEMEKQLDMYFESLSWKPESSSATHPPSGSARSESDHEPINGHALPQSPASSTAPEYGSMDLRRMVTSGIQQVSPELSNSPSFDHYVVSPEVLPAPELSNSPSFDHYVVSPEVSPAPELSNPPSLDHYVGSPEVSPVPKVSKASLDVVSTSDSGPSRSAASESDWFWKVWPQMEKPKSKSFLNKVVSKLSKLKFWRRISGPGSVRDAVNAARRELQGLVDTRAYVSASSPESQTFSG
jgi:hypothetical protein